MSDTKVFISDLTDDEPVETRFLAASKEVRETRNGDPYLCITLQDRTGTIEARAWDDADVLAERFEVDDFIAIRGRVTSYRGELQIKVADVDRLSDDDVALSDYLPHSRWEPDELFEALRELVERHVQSNEIRRFLNALFDDESWKKRFSRAPAAVKNHHAYFAGLLEHTLSMARLAVSMGRHYEAYYPGMVDTDLVVAGCVIHDMAKIEELEFERSFDYSTGGRLVGHIARGSELVGQIADRLDPPLDEHLTDQLKHLVLSHHGKREFGSPVTPRTPEAILLHYIDMTDSRMNACWNAMESLVDQDSEEWTDYQRNFDGSLYASGEAARGWRRTGDPAPTGDGPGVDPVTSASPSEPEETGETSESDTERATTEASVSTDETNLQLFDD